MADQAKVTRGSIPVYFAFAHPHSPADRCTDENLNRIALRALPQGDKITDGPRDLASVACDMNNRPKNPRLEESSEVFA